MKFRYRKSETYHYDYLRIYKYNDNQFKAIQFKKPVKKAGFEKDEDEPDNDNKRTDNKNDDEYLRQSLSRTRKTIMNYALCNPFEYFVTLTFDRKKIKASDLKMIKRKTGQWLNNLIKRHYPKLEYILIPELHKDKKHFHLHGLISGIGDVKEFRKSKKGVMRYNWLSWHNKFGFTSLEKIRNKDAVSHYITKYITKDIVTEFGQHRFLASKGLKKPELVYEKSNYIVPIQNDYENDYVRIKNLDTYDEFYTFMLELSNTLKGGDRGDSQTSYRKIRKVRQSDTIKRHT